MTTTPKQKEPIVHKMQRWSDLTCCGINVWHRSERYSLVHKWNGIPAGRRCKNCCAREKKCASLFRRSRYLAKGGHYKL